MNNYVKSFLKRGLMFSGFGPIIAGIVYLILSKTIDDFSLSGVQVFLAIISTYILPFLQAGASIFNQIEHWPVAKSVLCHFAVIYFAYLICYILNSWIPFKWTVILIFTLIFILTYLLIWLIVFLSVKKASQKMNKSLAKK